MLVLANNLWQNIFRLFHVLPQFSSPQMKQNQVIITRKWMCELPHELLNGLRLRILGYKEISRKSLKCLDLMVSTQMTTQKPNFDKSRKISSKHSIEQPILPNFVKFSTTFCPRLHVKIFETLEIKFYVQICIKSLANWNYVIDKNIKTIFSLESMQCINEIKFHKVTWSHDWYLL